jgi:lipoprotein-anchoring transpeptidase ErfK/SrfK
MRSNEYFVIRARSTGTRSVGQRRNFVAVVICTWSAAFLMLPALGSEAATKPKPALVAAVKKAVAPAATIPDLAAAAPTATVVSAPIVTPAGTGTPAPVTVVAAAKNAKTPIYATATGTQPFTVLNNKTNFSGRHVFVVQAKEGESYRVFLPMRPNGRLGYVRAADVTLYQHDYAVIVSLSKKTLTLYKAGVLQMTESVGVGKSQWPTPTGSFYMRELARPRNPRGSYGPWAFGLSAYSTVFQKFGRGDGQIGIHGTNEPKLLGTQVSHGCIRMRNEAITKLAQTLPQGVPVEIVA